MNLVNTAYYLIILYKKSIYHWFWKRDSFIHSRKKYQFSGY